MWIMGFGGIAMYIPVFLFLKETLTAHRAGQSGPQLVMER